VAIRFNVRFGSEADICSAIRHVRFTPESGHVRCTTLCPQSAKSGHSPIHSITSSARASNEGGAVRPSALAVRRDHKLVLGWRLHWQVGWLLTFEDTIDVPGRVAERGGALIQPARRVTLLASRSPHLGKPGDIAVFLSVLRPAPPEIARETKHAKKSTCERFR
jgi:hypothetical protein